MVYNSKCNKGQAFTYIEKIKGYGGRIMKKILYHGTNRDFKKFNRYTPDETNLLQEIFFTEFWSEFIH